MQAPVTIVPAAAGGTRGRAMGKGKGKGKGKGAYRLATAWAAVLLLVAVAEGAAAVRVEVRTVADLAALGDSFVYDVGPGGEVLVLTPDNIFDAGSGELLFREPLRKPAWLAFFGRRLLLLADGALFAIDGSVPKKLVEVPLKSPVLAADGERIFVSGVTAAGRSVLFLFREGNGYKPLLELDVPIDAMAARRGLLFFSAGSKIFALREGGAAGVVARLPGFRFIPSLAVDDQDDVLYFSDGMNVYALRGGNFVVVRQGLGGMLRVKDGDLFVLSWRERALFRMSGISRAFSSPGALAPMKDPCEEPVMALFCRLEEERALFRAAVALAGSGANGTPSAEAAAYLAERKKEIARIRALLAKEAQAGVQAVAWGGGNEPRTIGPRAQVAGGKRGAGLTLWDGTEVRVGPDSKAVLEECGPQGECRQVLEKGLMYVNAVAALGEDNGSRPAGFVVSAGELSLHFDSAKLALFASNESAGVVVIEGRVKATLPRGGSQVLAAGEMLEARKGEPLGAPKAADMARLNRWWEDVR